jgi:hypothetical protein
VLYLGRLAEHLPAQLRELVVEQFDRMEVTEDDHVLGRCAETADRYSAAISMATASILAPMSRNRFQNGLSTSAPLPSPTKTTAPRSTFMTVVR